MSIGIKNGQVCVLGGGREVPFSIKEISYLYSAHS